MSQITFKLDVEWEHEPFEHDDIPPRHQLVRIDVQPDDDYDTLLDTACDFVSDHTGWCVYSARLRAHNPMTYIHAGHHFEPTFKVSTPDGKFHAVENAPAYNMRIMYDHAAAEFPLMRRGWFCDGALAEAAQLFGGGN